MQNDIYQNYKEVNLENIENEVEFVTVKIAKDVDEMLNEVNKKTKIPKQWILDKILRNYFKDEKKEE